MTSENSAGGSMGPIPMLAVKGNLLEHAPFKIVVKPQAFPEQGLLLVVGALLENFNQDNFYPALAIMGRGNFEKYFEIIPDGTNSIGQEVDIEQIWINVERWK